MTEYTEMTGGLGWDSEIEDDSDGSFALLSPGDYICRITKIDRARYEGGAKIPPCNKAIIYMTTSTDDGPVTLRTTLLLHKTMEWKLSQFFRAIGEKKPGEKVKMNFDKAPGSVLRVHVRTRSYTTPEGETRPTNDVDKFYDFDPELLPQEPAWDAYDEELPFEFQ